MKEEGKYLDKSKIRDKEDLLHFLEEMDKEEKRDDNKDPDIIKKLFSRLDLGEVNYDEGEVEACPNCNSLYLVDTDDGPECFTCGHELEEKDIIINKSIFHYLDEDSEDTNINS